MKTLKEHINEHNITSLYNTILSKIENINPANVDDDTVKIFRRIHSNLQTLDNISGEAGEEINLITKLDAYLEEKGLDFCKKDITQILINSGELKKYVSIISDNNKLVEFNDILDGSNKNLIDIIYVSLKKQIRRRTLQKLATLKPTQRRITKGDFEVFLKLFTNSTANNDGDYNPIISGNKHATVELKNGEGVFAGQNTWQDNTAGCDEFNKNYGFSIMPLTSKNKNYLPLIKLCENSDDASINKICKDITNVYVNSVKYNDENLCDNLKNQIKNNIISCLNSYDTEINVNLQKRFKTQFDELRKILATFSLICYHQLNKFQFLLISKKTDNYSDEFGKYKIFEMPAITSKLDWKNYAIIIEDIQYFKSMPSCDNNASHNISLDWTAEK